MTRRRLLTLLLLILGAVVIPFLWRPWRLIQLVADAFKPRIDPSSATGALSDDEMASVVAFAEVLVEERTLSPAERGYLIEHVTDRTRSTPGYLALYRTTATLLDRLARTSFAALDLRGRADVMIRHRLTVSEVRIREYLLPFRRPELLVRALAVPDLIHGYYRSPAGWAVVGYAAFPGRCSNLIRYTRREG